MKRLLPNTIFARLFALVVISIIISHVMTFVLVVNFFDRHFPPPAPLSFQSQSAPNLHRLPPDKTRTMWHIGNYSFLPLPPGLWIGLIVQFLTLSAAAWFGARLLARPMQKLAQASIGLSDNLNSEPIIESGPDEARQAARVFNVMQRKICAQIEERERFVAAVSHDLRTPLTRMKLRIENLAENYAKEKLRDDIGEMTLMLDSTLEYLRGRVANEPLQLLDVYALIEAVVEDACANGDDVAMSGAAYPLFTRPVTLRRCFGNLLENALRYGQDATVSLTDSDDMLIIEVRDHGPGIPDDKMAFVCEPFIRLDSSRNRTTGGVGLGLSIAREAALQCDGQLTLRNAIDGGLIARIALKR